VVEEGSNDGNDADGVGAIAGTGRPPPGDAITIEGEVGEAAVRLMEQLIAALPSSLISGFSFSVSLSFSFSISLSRSLALFLSLLFRCLRVVHWRFGCPSGVERVVVGGWKFFLPPVQWMRVFLQGSFHW
jgi:hypothetical protein